MMQNVPALQDFHLAGLEGNSWRSTREKEKGDRQERSAKEI